MNVTTPTPASKAAGAFFASRALVLAGLFAAAALLGVAPAASAATAVSGAITQDTTWTAAEGPYLVDGLTVEAGATLTIEAGTVVKMGDGAAIGVLGSLVVEGTDSRRAVFTSWRDDLHGGDADGAPFTIGAPGDWFGIRAYSGAAVSLDGTAVLYGTFGLYSYGMPATDAVSFAVRDCYFSGNSVGAAYVYGRFDLTAFGNEAYGNGTNGFVLMGEPARDQRWVAGLPYVVGTYGAPLRVPAGVTLTLGPGAVVKAASVSLDVYGTLVTEGTADAPVIFTSLKDDSAGGDTNGDGSAASPTPGNWTGVRLLGGVGRVSDAVVRYSQTGLANRGGDLFVDSSRLTLNSVSGLYQELYGKTVVSGTEISSSPYGANISAGASAFTGSSFHSNSSHGLLVSSHASPATATGNWWGDASGPYHPTLNPAGTGDRVSNNVLFEPWLDHDPTAVPTGPSLSSLAQRGGGGDEVAEGGTVTETRDLRIDATVSSADGSGVRLQVEFRPVSEAFDGTVTDDSGLLPSGVVASLPIVGLQDGDYHWRARAVDAAGNASEWREFGTAGNADVTVDFVETIRVAVIPADLQGEAHDLSSTFSSGCKLDYEGKQTSFVGHAKAYYEDLAYCVSDYYRENSFDTVDLEFTVVDGWAQSDVPVSSLAYNNRNSAGYNQVLEDFYDQALTYSGISEDDFDLAVIVHSGTSWQRTGDEQKVPTLAQIPRNGAQFVVVAEDDLVGQWSHEVSHAVGILYAPLNTWTPDLYKMGNMRYWDLMGLGDKNGDFGSDPALMGAYVRDFLGWTRQEILPKSAYGDGYWINSLETSNAYDDILRYNLEDSASESVQKYYLLEARGRGLGNWSSSIPGQAIGNLVISYVDERGRIEYGYDATGWPYNEFRRVNMAAALDPSQDNTYRDLENLVEISAPADRMHDGKYEIQAGIQPLNPTWFEGLYAGTVLKGRDALADSVTFLLPNVILGPKEDRLKVDSLPEEYSRLRPNISPSVRYLDSLEWSEWLGKVSVAVLLLAVVVFLTSLLVGRIGTARGLGGANKGRVWLLMAGRMRLVAKVVLLAGAVCIVAFAGLKYYQYREIKGSFFGHPEGTIEMGAQYPDLDLHVFCSDGRHVGVNYDTGEYEVQIEGAITNGDNVGAPEWIFFPPTPENASCRHSVSARDNEEFLAANPEIAAQIPDPTDSYDIYARSIDPATGILTSATLESQPIEPGETVAHALSLAPDGTPTVAPGVVDLVPPVTAASLSGTEGDNGWYLGPVTVTLAADDADGSGVASTDYSTDGGLNWTAYSAPFEISGDGAHTIMFGSRDGAGNSEATQSVEIRIYSGPTLSNLAQRDGEGNPVAEGGTVKGADLTLSAELSASSGEPVRLEVEMRPLAEPFTGMATATSEYQSYEGTFSVPVKAYLDTDYHWQARAAYEGGAASEWQEFGSDPSAADFAEFTRTVRVGVVMVEPYGMDAGSWTPTQAPCKLLSKSVSDYPTYGRAYYDDLVLCLKDYYKENSYDKIALDITFPGGDVWNEITDPARDESYYRKGSPDEFARLVNLANRAVSLSGINTDDYDGILSLHAGSSSQKGSLIPSSALPLTKPVIHLAEDDPLGEWAHELGHMIGVLTTPLATSTPDLYEMGNVGSWAIMAGGAWNGNGTDPAPFCSYTKEFLGWLDMDSALDPAVNHDVWVTALESNLSGDSVIRLNAESGGSLSAQKYYLLEARTRYLGNWGTSMPAPASESSNLVLYYVDEKGQIEYGYDALGSGRAYNQSRDIDMVASLNPGLQETFKDYANGIKVTAVADQSAGGKYQILAAVRPFDWADETDDLVGTVLDAGRSLYDKWLAVTQLTYGPDQPTVSGPVPKSLQDLEKYQVYEIGPSPLPGKYREIGRWALLVMFFLFVLTLVIAAVTRRRKPTTVVGIAMLLCGLIAGVLYWRAQVIENGTGMKSRFSQGPDSVGWNVMPDLDLHVFCSDGRHVGVNYDTGEYEVQIEGAITNGDNVGAPEWIFFPPTPENASCRHSVSARDNEEFLAANPEIAAQIPDPTDSYDIYARSIDPATGILTSATLESQPILLGETVAHALSLAPDGTPTVAPGVVDLVPPVTAASLSGTEGDNGWYLGPVTVTLAADDAGGSGVASTEYSTDGGLTWETYSAPFIVEGDGAHAVMFGSRDGAGNSEATKTLEVRIDAAAPEISAAAPADGLEAASPAVAVSGAASDATSGLASVSVNGVACEASGDSWSCPAVPLSEGANMLIATATDAAGNAAAASIAVTFTPDFDADGVPDSDDPCPTSAGDAAWQGCPSAVPVTFQRHTVGSGPRPGSTKAPVAGAEVKAFSLAPGSCADSVGVSPHDYGLVHGECATPFSAVTGPDGLASVGLLPGTYLLAAMDPQTQVFAGVHSGAIALGESPEKFLQVIVTADGSSVPAKTTKRTGSLLYIVEPEYVEWDSATELYPFILDAPDGEWGVTVAARPPEGFTADYESLSETVTDDYRALQFTLTDEGSCWECGTSFEIQIDHKGRREAIRRTVPTPMTEAFARQKGLDLTEMRARGVTVTAGKPGRGRGSDR